MSRTCKGAESPYQTPHTSLQMFDAIGTAPASPYLQAGGKVGAVLEQHDASGPDSPPSGSCVVSLLSRGTVRRRCINVARWEGRVRAGLWVKGALRELLGRRQVFTGGYSQQYGRDIFVLCCFSVPLSHASSVSAFGAPPPPPPRRHSCCLNRLALPTHELMRDSCRSTGVHASGT